jgi:hypothetical protein
LGWRLGFCQKFLSHSPDIAKLAIKPAQMSGAKKISKEPQEVAHLDKTNWRAHRKFYDHLRMMPSRDSRDGKAEALGRNKSREAESFEVRETRSARRWTRLEPSQGFLKGKKSQKTSVDESFKSSQ